MLTEDQVNELWNETRAAQVRSLYFADLGARYTTRKQVISGVSLFLASGAAAAIGARISSWWIPLVMTTLTAVLNAYSISVGLDKKASAMVRLHSLWSQIERDRRQLWNRWYEEDAEAKLREIDGRDADASQLGITDAPYDRRALEKWERFVDQQYAPAQTQEPVTT